MNQPDIYMYLLPFGFPSPLGHHTALSRVLCAIQYFLISFLSYCLVAVYCSVPKSSLTLEDPMNFSPPGSSVLGTSQARIWVGCYFLLQGIFPTRDGIHITCIGRWTLHHRATWEALFYTYFQVRVSPTLPVPLTPPLSPLVSIYLFSTSLSISLNICKA